MTFTERFPDVVTPNPGGPLDPLGESVLDESQPWLRCFDPVDTRLVIGRGQDPHRELRVDHARADGVPIHRRVCGGGAVVLAPGMLVIALRLPRGDRFPDAWLQHLGGVLAEGLSSPEHPVLVRGHGDLAIATEGGERKVLGSSLRLTGPWCIYLASLLLSDQRSRMDRYLASPSREPDYRKGRGHGEFCAWLDLAPDLAQERIETACKRAFP